MSTIRKTITLSSQMDLWVKRQIKSGRYANDSEYVRDLIRRDQDIAEKSRKATDELRRLIQEGIDSGVSTKRIPDIMAEVEERLRGDGRLPTDRKRAGRRR